MITCSFMLGYLLLATIACTQKDPAFSFKKIKNDDSGKAMMPLVTDYITWDDASKMIGKYKAHPRTLKVKLEDGTTPILEGLQIDANFLRAMLEDQKVQKIELYFAVNKSQLSSPQADQTFTIITAPVYYDIALRKYTVKKYRDPAGSRTTTTNSELIDFCDPCPRNCPDTTN